MADLQPKQFNIATGPQGTRWDDSMIKADDRWKDQSEREHGAAYMADVEATRRGESPHYYPGQGGPGTRVQGKLFHDPKPTDPHRWPRGFTPERKTDVDVTFETHRPGSDDAVANRAREAIARSSMPTEDLNLLRGGEWGSKNVEIYSGVNNPNWSGVWEEREVVVESERRRRRSLERGGGGPPGARPVSDRPIGPNARGRIGLNPDVSAHTVLHEVGHAMSTVRGTHRTPTFHGAHEATDKESGRVYRMPLQKMSDRAALMGAEEARADIYGTKYAKQRSGEPSRRKDNYSGMAGYPGFITEGNVDLFDAAYEGEHAEQGRPTPRALYRQEAEQKQAEVRKASLADLRAQNYRANQLLFRRRGKDANDPTPDYGQWGYDDYSGDEDLGTIRMGGGPPESALQSTLRHERKKERLRH